jgi:hypothetical protein
MDWSCTVPSQSTFRYLLSPTLRGQPASKMKASIITRSAQKAPIAQLNIAASLSTSAPTDKNMCGLTFYWAYEMSLSSRSINLRDAILTDPVDDSV